MIELAAYIVVGFFVGFAAVYALWVFAFGLLLISKK